MAEENWAVVADEQEALSSDVKKLDLKAELKNGETNDVSSPSDSGDAGNESSDNSEHPLTEQEMSHLKKLLHDKLIQNNQELEVQQRDPNSPLYSIKSFESLNLKKELLQGIYQMGFNRPSKIQETALPLLLKRPPENMIAQSQSGTGKTAAFVLAMLTSIDLDKAHPQCLCLSPTYELALQTGKVVQLMGKLLTKLSVAYAVRGNAVARGSQIESQIVIGTPGTTMDWIRRKAFDASRVHVFVLDEADVMIDTQGFKDQSIRIKRTLSPTCQLLLFSATYDKKVMDFATKVVTEPNIIQLRREEETLDNIKQYYATCTDNTKKFEALQNIYTVLNVGQAIIFCHTRRTAKWLAEKLVSEGFVVALLSGQLTVEQRADILRRFKKGLERVLVTTNVCSRGIDVEQVTLVINFDLPMNLQHEADCETYLHRIGRTGRFGKSGVAINFVTDNRDMDILNQIQRHFGIKMEHLNTTDIEDMDGKIGEQD